MVGPWHNRSPKSSSLFRLALIFVRLDYDLVRKIIEIASLLHWLSGPHSSCYHFISMQSKQGLLKLHMAAHEPSNDQAFIAMGTYNGLEKASCHKLSAIIL